MASQPGILQRRGVRQFVKFCIIGFSSMILDVLVAYLLTFGHGAHLNPYLARTISFTVAVTNGYLWNTLWTFRGSGSGKHHEQYARFVAVNIVGLGLNILIMTVVFRLLSGHSMPAKLRMEDRIPWACAMAPAIAIVAIWNFLANKYWTYRQTTTPRTTA